MEGVRAATSRSRRVVVAAAVSMLVVALAVALTRVLERTPLPPQVLDATATAPTELPPSATATAVFPSEPTEPTEPSEPTESSDPTESPDQTASEQTEEPSASDPVEPTPDPVDPSELPPVTPPPAQPSDPPGDFWDAFTVTVATDAPSYRPGVNVQVTTTVCNVSEYEQWVYLGDFVQHEYRRLDGPNTHVTGSVIVDYFDNTGPFSWPAGHCRPFEDTWYHTNLGAASGTYHVMASWDGVGAEGATEMVLSEPFRLLPEEGETFIDHRKDLRFETTVTSDAREYTRGDEVSLTVTTCNVSGEAVEAHGRTMIHEIAISAPDAGEPLATRELRDASDVGRPTHQWAADECRSVDAKWAGGDDRWSWTGHDGAPERLPAGKFTARGSTMFIEDVAADDQIWWHSSQRAISASEFTTR